MRESCYRCGARRVDRQLGLERTPDEYVAHLVEVFREVRRVLRADGVCWLNIGDCYATGAGAVGDAPGGGAQGERWKKMGPARKQVPDSKAPNAGVPTTQPNRMPIEGLKPKDLVGMPWRVAFALQADGWWIRSDVIWAKPNPMPESIVDRPTQAHEHVFLLAKSRRYFYDADAIREAHSGSPAGNSERKLATGANGERPDDHLGSSVPWQPDGRGRNKRNVWEIATQPFPDAHFATFPPKLVEPCVLAGSSPQACAVCGAPWRRITERVTVPGSRRRKPELPQASEAGQGRNGQDSETFGEYQVVRTIGWEPSCPHSDGSGRGVVLDPFAGSGTVGVVCEWYGRDFIGVELNPEYAKLAERRIATDGALRRPAYRPRPPADSQLGLLD